MRAADRPVSTVENDATMWAGVRQAPAIRHLDVVLKPLSRPDLGEISVEAAVFAIGRIEEPFDSYGNDVLNMLSRRHASLFRKEGFVYLVDLQSRNGTTVNRVGIGHEPCQLRDGDEICFGGSLSYRIQITPRVRPEGSLTLKLTPESGDSGLETIVVAKFPLLVSKTDGIFGHYKSDEAHGPELKYLSRRHAHIYQKGDQAYIGDLGSANGTFVDGERLQEQAVPLQDGALIAFGGKHFVYRVGIIRETGVEPADGETRQHLTEQRVTIHRESLLSREALEARIAAEPGAAAPEAAAPAVVSAKPERKAEVKVSSVAKSAPLTVASPKAESKGIWGIFGRRAESKPQVAAVPKAESAARAPAVVAGSPKSDSNPAGTIASKADRKPLGAVVSKAESKQPGGSGAKPQAAVDAQDRKTQMAGSLNRKAEPRAEGSPGAAGMQQGKPTPQAAVGLQPTAQPPQALQPKPPLSQQPLQAQQSKQSQAQQSPQAPQSKQPQSQQPSQAPQSKQPQPQQPSQPPQSKQPQPQQQPPQSQQQSQQPQPANDLNLLAMDSGTQFMAAGTTFLTVLCAADSPKKEVAPDPAAVEAAAKEASAKRRPRGRVLMLLSELATLLKSDPDGTSRKKGRYIALAAAILAAFITAMYIWNASERAFKEAVARSDYTRATAIAVRLLDKHPDDIELRAKATDVGLKATVPAWLKKIRARDFDGAKGVLTGAAELSKRDSDLRPLIDELEWLGGLEKLVSERGGPEAPIRIYADEDNIERVVSRWNEDTGEHQRSLARIASYVPEFVDWYGEALTHLRRLQSESSVYLPVVERVKVNIATELSRDNPDVLKPSLKEIADKYPRLGGMDVVRQDLARYTQIRHEARSRKSGRLFALLEKAHFVTPPIQQSFHALVQSGQLPPADLLEQYNAATRTWREHNPTDALAELQKLTTGSWGDYLTRELDRRGTVASGFGSLQLSKSAPDYVDRLLAFRETLDTDEDVYFVRATAADLTQQKDKVIAKAQDAISQARTHWQEYKNAGAIDASQRIETSVSEDFKSRAKSLAEASTSVQQAFRLYSLVDASGATQWTAIRDEIETEVNEQRSRLRDLSNVVEPALLNTKLALLGDANE